MHQQLSLDTIWSANNMPQTGLGAEHPLLLTGKRGSPQVPREGSSTAPWGLLGGPHLHCSVKWPCQVKLRPG